MDDDEGDVGATAPGTDLEVPAQADNEGTTSVKKRPGKVYAL